MWVLGKDEYMCPGEFTQMYMQFLCLSHASLDADRAGQVPASCSPGLWSLHIWAPEKEDETPFTQGQRLTAFLTCENLSLGEALPSDSFPSHVRIFQTILTD